LIKKLTVANQGKGKGVLSNQRARSHKKGLRPGVMKWSVKEFVKEREKTEEKREKDHTGGGNEDKEAQDQHTQ